MKLIALAAVLAMGAPALAQDMPEQDTMTEQPAGTTTNPAPGQTAPPPPMSQQAPTDAPMPAQTTPPAGQPMQQPAQQPMANAPAGDPTGGYQPSAPPLSGSPMAGQQVIFQAGPSPDQAYPAPAPLAEYPVCKRGETDKCRNPGGR